MRMRRKRNLEERLAACKDVCLGWLTDYASEQRGEAPMERFDVMKVFGNNNPVHLEVGCGKGQFIQKLAEQNPDINYIAVEQTSNVIVTAMERTLRAGTPNLRYYMGKAEYLQKAFLPQSVELIYLNFSCPYPKAHYAKHRLTHPLFLEIYADILVNGGMIKQKTDNMTLFEFSLNSFSECGWKMQNITFDLHSSKISGNIMTEYEERFTAMGMPIYYLEAINKKWK